MKLIKEKWFTVMFTLILSFVFLLFASKCSPLYVINDWVDPNAFFTVGKGMMNGLVPYLDLFEQKGPLLFFLHGLAYLVSPTSFFGVYLLEGIFFAFFLYYAYQTFRLYLSENVSLLLLPLLAALILSNGAFRMGDSAEEFCLPFLMYSLYLFLAYFKGVRPLRDKDFIVVGILAGCVLWIKYTMIGFWFAWMMCFFFEYLIRKDYLKAFSNCFSFLLGMGIATLPWLLYFTYHNAMPEFIEVYFLINMNSYSHDINLLEKLWLPFKLFYQNLCKYPLVFWLLLLGIPYFTCSWILSKEKRGRFFFLLLLLFLILTVYIGGFGYKYYFFIFVPFLLFGLVAIFHYLEWSPQNRKMPFVLLFICLFSFLYLYKTSPNVPDMKLQKEDYAQYYFLKYIEEDSTLLNYGFIDGGFYLTSNIIPNVRYFEKLNLKRDKFPENMDEQERYVKEGCVDFIVFRSKVTTDPNHLNVPYLYENYEYVDSFIERGKDNPGKYLLFQKQEKEKIA